jgi:hypothetical protein
MKNKRLSLVIIALIVLAILGCDQKVFTGSVECSECYQEKPDKYFLSVYLTFNDSITEIPLKLCKGNIEDGDVLGYDTARANNDRPFLFFEDVYIDRDYSMSAEYRFTGKTLYVVDGTHPNAKLVTNVCDQQCWVVDDNAMELEIKDEFLK